LKTLWIKRKKDSRSSLDKQCRNAQMNNVGNLENYWIFPSNLKTDGMEVQPYFDHFQRHHIPFLYRLPYLPNNTKMTKKIWKNRTGIPRNFTDRFHPYKASILRAGVPFTRDRSTWYRWVLLQPTLGGGSITYLCEKNL
jgi:hypothetical protein